MLADRQTDRQTDTVITILRSPTGVEVITARRMVETYADYLRHSNFRNSEGTKTLPI